MHYYYYVLNPFIIDDSRGQTEFCQLPKEAILGNNTEKVARAFSARKHLFYIFWYFRQLYYAEGVVNRFKNRRFDKFIHFLLWKLIFFQFHYY